MWDDIRTVAWLSPPQPPVLIGLDATSYEQMVVHTAWHQLGHALSLARAEPADIRDGRRLLDLAPDGVREFIRGGGYRPRNYVHELVAEIYGLLMLRRRHGDIGPPLWLDDEILELVRRVCGWTE
jgi:hypothetical protein